MTKIQEQLYGIQTQQRLLGQIYVYAGSTNQMGVNVNFLLRQTADTNKFQFGRFAVCRKACFIGHLNAVNSIAAVEKTNFTTKKWGKKHIRVQYGRRISLRSHAGHFFCVSSLMFFLFFSSRSYTNSSIFILAVGNVLRKTALLPNRKFVLIAVSEESLHSRQSFCTTARSIRRILQPEKTPQKPTL